MYSEGVFQAVNLTRSAVSSYCGYKKGEVFAVEFRKSLSFFQLVYYSSSISFFAQAAISLAVSSIPRVEEFIAIS